MKSCRISVLIVSTIHEFDDILANINTRESLMVLVDAAHRTTGGDLGNYLTAALPNATYIGFADEVGIHIYEWQIDLQHGPAGFGNLVGVAGEHRAVGFVKMLHLALYN